MNGVSFFPSSFLLWSALSPSIFRKPRQTVTSRLLLFVAALVACELCKLGSPSTAPLLVIVRVRVDRSELPGRGKHGGTID